MAAEVTPAGCPHVPACLEWDAEGVAEWIERLGFPQYKVYMTHTSGNNALLY